MRIKSDRRLTISLAANFILALVIFGRLFWAPSDVAKLVKSQIELLQENMEDNNEKWSDLESRTHDRFYGSDFMEAAELNGWEIPERLKERMSRP